MRLFRPQALQGAVIFSVLMAELCGQESQDSGLFVYGSFPLSRNKNLNWKPFSGRSQENEML